MELSSPAFRNNQSIPPEHTNKGVGVHPPLDITSVPPGTQSLALIVHDPDAASGDLVHWVVWNISAATRLIPEDRIPSGAVQGVNDGGTQDYYPPSPPAGTHRYIFDIYALNRELTLNNMADSVRLHHAMQGHIIAQSQLIGLVSA